MSSIATGLIMPVTDVLKNTKKETGDDSFATQHKNYEYQ